MPTVIDYRDLPGFPQPSVEGHAGRLSLGKIGETPVAVLQGRAHYYEHGRADAMKVPVRTLARDRLRGARSSPTPAAAWTRRWGRARS